MSKIADIIFRKKREREKKQGFTDLILVWSGLLFKGETAAAAGDPDLALAPGDPHHLTAAGTAEEGIFLALAEAVPVQTEPPGHLAAEIEIFLVFRGPL